MKWYEYRNPYTGETRWWTQRDKNGNCFEIRKAQASNQLRLFVNETYKSTHDTLIEAQRVAAPLWNS